MPGTRKRFDTIFSNQEVMDPGIVGQQFTDGVYIGDGRSIIRTFFDADSPPVTNIVKWAEYILGNTYYKNPSRGSIEFDECEAFMIGVVSRIIENCEYFILGKGSPTGMTVELPILISDITEFEDIHLRMNSFMNHVERACDIEDFKNQIKKKGYDADTNTWTHTKETNQFKDKNGWVSVPRKHPDAQGWM